jgi:hypothetical protein
MSHSSPAPIVSQPAVCLMTFPYLPMVAPSATSMGDLAMVPLS